MHEIYLEKSAEKDLRKLPVSVFQRVPVHLKALSIDPTRLLKNAHLLRYPAASPSWQRGKKVLLIRCDATPSSFPVSSTGQACCGVHPSTRRLSVLGPQNFACLRVAASAEAGGPCIWAFLNSLRKIQTA